MDHYNKNKENILNLGTQSCYRVGSLLSAVFGIRDRSWNVSHMDTGVGDACSVTPVLRARFNMNLDILLWVIGLFP